MIRLAWPKLESAHLRLAARTTVAAAGAYGLMLLFDLPKGYWAVLTAVLVVQTTIGATIGASFDRALGTFLGAVVGVAGAILAGPSPLLTGIALGLSILMLSAAAARWPSLKLGPVTATIVLLSDPTHAEPLTSALERVAEIAIGCSVGFLAALTVLPAHAMDNLRATVARGLEDCASLLELLERRLLGEAAPGDLLPTSDRIRAALRGGDALLGEARREQTGHLSDHADGAPLVRTLRRLYHSAIILLRAAAVPLPEPALGAIREPLQAATRAAAAEIRALAAALRARQAPGRAGAEALAAAVSDLRLAVDGERASGRLEAVDAHHLQQIFALVFAFGQLQINLADFAERVTEQAGSAAKA